MRADTTIKAVESIAGVSRKGGRVNSLFRLLANPEILWKQAYANLYFNRGAITRGVDDATLDGFSMDRVGNLIRLLYAKEYRFAPVRRAYIAKSNNKLRPLGIPTGDDKLVQEAVRILLERIYEPVFSPNSHGFRPKRSCHTALMQAGKQWLGIKWIIEFDIKGFFDNINHSKMIEILERKIDDKRIISLVRQMLKAGYMEEWKWNPSYSGTPQGGVTSPMLANIYLHELDMFMEKQIAAFYKGKKRATNPEYAALASRLWCIRLRIRKKIQGKRLQNPHISLDELYQEEKKLCAQMRCTPSKDHFDAEYRRLRYIRYADDFIVGVIGSKEEAVAILQTVREFVQQELGLELSAGKTCIRHAKKGVRFLGYDIKTYTMRNRLKKVEKNGISMLKRTITDAAQLHVPPEWAAKFCKEHGYGNYDIKGMRAHARPLLMQRSDAEIILTYNAEMRGMANYYALATGYKITLRKLIAMAQFSFFATLAAKHKTNTPKIMRQLRLHNQVGYGVTVCVQGKTRIYRLFRLADHKRPTLLAVGAGARPKTEWFTLGRSEIVRRLNANACEYCEAREGSMEVHHVRALKDVEKGKALWEKMMSNMRRKTMILCSDCHKALHGPGLPEWRAKTKTT